MILKVDNLKKTFYKKNNHFTAVDDVSFNVDEGECLGIIGESGSGKSTVANMVAGLIPCDSGEMYFLDSKLPEKPSRTGQLMRKNMQMVFQNPVLSFNPKMTVFDSVAEGLRYNTKKTKKEIENLVYETLDMVDIPREYATKKSFELSGGESQRVAIARAIIIRPKLLICDEVTSSLDVSVQAQIIKLLYHLKCELDMSYIFISHDLALVSSICDRVIVMKNGQVVEQGYTKDILYNPQQDYTKMLIKSVLTVD